MNEEKLHGDSKMEKFVREMNSFLDNATVLTMEILSTLHELLWELFLDFYLQEYNHQTTMWKIEQTADNI